MLAKLRMSSIPSLVSEVSKGSVTRQIHVDDAVERVATFMRSGNVVVLTGAGVSVDSGIQSYRGRDGLYTTNPKFK